MSIVHSERIGPDRRSCEGRLFGIQAWVALPKAAEETAPAFACHSGASLPTLDGDGVRLRLIVGEGWGERAPVAVSSSLFCADAATLPGAVLLLPEGHEGRAMYLLDGEVDVAGDRFEPTRMLVFCTGDRLAMHAGLREARVLLDGTCHLVWSFVSSSRERIEQAKANWKAERFGRVTSDEGVHPASGDAACAQRDGGWEVSAGHPRLGLASQPATGRLGILVQQTA